MGKAQVFGFVICIVLNQIYHISAEPSNNYLHSKDSLSSNTITNANFDSGEILPGRYKRDINADKIFVEINRLYDKIDELSSQLEQVEENRKKEILTLTEGAKNAQGIIEGKLFKFAALLNKVEQDKITMDSKLGDMDAKFNLIEELVSKKFNECLNTIKEHEEVGTRRQGIVELNINRIEGSFSNLTNIFSAEIKQNEEVGSRRLGNFELNINRMEQSFSNITKEISTKMKENDVAFSKRFVDIEEQISQIQQRIWSNRIKDGPSQCRLWPDGQVPFEIDSTLSSNIRRLIDEAIDDFHNKTCIRWVPRQSEDAFVYFSKTNNRVINKTEECYTGGRRISIVGEEFNSRKEVLRQMVYILGLGDEHLRKDRDEHIELQWSNCTIGEKYPHLNGGGFYDYQSITHPKCSAKDCINDKYIFAGTWEKPSCGHQTSLSVLDSNKLNEMYSCNGCHSLRYQFLDQIGFNESSLVPVFENAHENRKYICRVQHSGWVRIGRGSVKTGECHYVFIRPRVTYENVQFLTNPQQTKIQWMSRGSGFPKNAIPGGYDKEGTSYYIARCAEEPQWGESVVAENMFNHETLMHMYKRDASGNRCSSFDILSCS